MLFWSLTLGVEHRATDTDLGIVLLRRLIRWLAAAPWTLRIREGPVDSAPSPERDLAAG